MQARKMQILAHFYDFASEKLLCSPFCHETSGNLGLRLEHSDCSFTGLDYASERALRPAKTKMIVIEQFRSHEGANNYATIMTIAKTAEKNGKNPFIALLKAGGVSRRVEKHIENEYNAYKLYITIGMVVQSRMETTGLNSIDKILPQLNY